MVCYDLFIAHFSSVLDPDPDRHSRHADPDQAEPGRCQFQANKKVD